MTNKIRIISGFASAEEVAKELGVSKTEMQAIEDILNRPAVRKKASPNGSDAFAARKASTKRGAPVARQSSRSGSKTIWQIVKASKKTSRSSGH